MSLEEKKPYYKYFEWLDQIKKNEEEDIFNEMKRKMENELARVNNEIRWLKLGFGVLGVVIVVLIVLVVACITK